MPGISPDDGAIDDGGVPGGDTPHPDPDTVVVDLAVALFTSQNPNGAVPGSVVLAREAGGAWGTREQAQYLIIPSVTITTDDRAALFPAERDGTGAKFLGTIALAELMADAAPAQADALMTDMLDPCENCQPFLSGGVAVPLNVLDHLTITEHQVEP